MKDLTINELIQAIAFNQTHITFFYGIRYDIMDELMIKNYVNVQVPKDLNATKLSDIFIANGFQSSIISEELIQVKWY